jgi:hypothetical protein
MLGTGKPEYAPVKVVDGCFFATTEDMEWSEDYESTHMFIEDYCMRVRQAGKPVWCIDSYYTHASGGTLDDRYWRSVQKFRHTWKHMLPEDIPPVGVFKKFAQKNIANGKFKNGLIHKGGWHLAWAWKNEDEVRELTYEEVAA